MGSPGTPLSWDGRLWLAPIYTPLPTCHHVKFGSSATKGVRINRKEFQNWGALRDTAPWDWGVANQLKQAHSPYVLPRQIW